MAAEQEHMMGGLSEEKPADFEVQKFCDQVKHDVEARTKKNYEIFKAIAYKTQIVAGTNYFVKVQVGSDDYVELRIFKPLPVEGQKISLDGIKEGLKADDPITPI